MYNIKSINFNSDAKDRYDEYNPEEPTLNDIDNYDPAESDMDISEEDENIIQKFGSKNFNLQVTKDSITTKINEGDFKYIDKSIDEISNSETISNKDKGLLYVEILNLLYKATEKHKKLKLNIEEILSIAKKIIEFTITNKITIIDLTIAMYLKICKQLEAFENVHQIYTRAKDLKLVTPNILIDYMKIGNFSNNVEPAIQAIYEYFLIHKFIAPDRKQLNSNYQICMRPYTKEFIQTFYIEYFKLFQKNKDIKAATKFLCEYCEDAPTEMIAPYFKLCIELFEADGQKILETPKVRNLIEDYLPMHKLTNYINKYLTTPGEEFKAEYAFKAAIQLGLMDPDLLSDMILSVTGAGKTNPKKAIEYCELIILNEIRIPCGLAKSVIQCTTSALQSNPEYIKDIKKIYLHAVKSTEEAPEENRDSHIWKLHYAIIKAAKKIDDWHYIVDIFTKLSAEIVFAYSRMTTLCFYALDRLHQGKTLISYYIKHKDKFKDTFALTEPDNKIANIIIHNAMLAKKVTLARDIYKEITDCQTTSSKFKDEIANKLYSTYINAKNFVEAQALWAKIPAKTVCGYGSYMRYLLIHKKEDIPNTLLEIKKLGPVPPNVYVIYIVYLCYLNDKTTIKNIVIDIENTKTASALLIGLLIIIMHEKKDEQLIRTLINLANHKQVLSKKHISLTEDYCRQHYDLEFAAYLSTLEPRLEDQHEKNIANALSKLQAMVNLKITYKTDNLTQPLPINDIDWEKLSEFFGDSEEIMPDNFILVDIPEEDIDFSNENDKKNSSATYNNSSFIDEFILAEIPVEPMYLSEKKTKSMHSEKNDDTNSSLVSSSTTMKSSVCSTSAKSGRANFLESLISPTSQDPKRTANFFSNANKLTNNPTLNQSKQKVPKIPLKKSVTAKYFQAERMQKPPQSTQLPPVSNTMPLTATIADFHHFIRNNKSESALYASNFCATYNIEIDYQKANTHFNKELNIYNLTILTLKGISSKRLKEISNKTFTLPSPNNPLAVEQKESTPKNSKS